MSRMFRDQAARHANRDRLTEVLDDALSGRTTAEWLEALGGAVPCAPVYDVRQALENPFLAERGGVQVVDHPDRPGFKLLASPIRMGAAVPNRPAPKLGQDTDALLEELGYDPAEIAGVARAGRDLSAPRHAAASHAALGEVVFFTRQRSSVSGLARG